MEETATLEGLCLLWIPTHVLPLQRFGSLALEHLPLLIDFDQNTLANMTAALEHVCRQIPADRDTPDIRKRIANELIASARAGMRTYVGFQDAGMKAEITRPRRSKWLGGLLRRPAFLR
jgi:hypothetical protein